MKNTDNHDNFDVIVIGAGVSGLIAANVLAKRGFKTALVEKNDHVGGCCVNIKRGEFTFDAGVHFINSAGKEGPLDKILSEFMNFEDIRFIPLKEFVHWIDLKNDIDFVIPMEFNEYVDELTKFFPDEETGIRDFFIEYEKVVRLLLDMMTVEKPSQQISFLLKKIKTTMKFLKTTKSSVKQIHEGYINNEVTKETLSYLVTSLAMFPEDFTALVYLLMEMTIRFAGTYYIKGGGGFLTKKLGDAFLKNKGHLFLNTEAISFEIEEKYIKALKIRDINGESILNAKEYIIACDANRFATKLCPKDSLPEKYKNKILSKKPSNSSITLFLGLDIELKDYGFNEYEIWIYGRHPNTRENVEKCVSERDFSNMPLEIISIYSNIDKTCCPPGKSVLSITYPSHYEAWSEYLESNGDRLEDYKKEKERLTNFFIDILSKSLKIDDLKEHIEVVEFVTPLTIIQTTYNLGGSHLGWETKVESYMKNRINLKTPFKNGRLAGQWVFPGGGITSVTMSGYVAARNTIRVLEK
ncbi:MAG: NAD(P)/FAD-dependent oxidoreductase [Candidatus Lokiarchaeota archaeon]|nr:NAD(P)/FAD-dependent oxidoreductase [Candidatus Lokiarchaeota archaeon]